MILPTSYPILCLTTLAHCDELEIATDYEAQEALADRCELSDADVDAFATEVGL